MIFSEINTCFKFSNNAKTTGVRGVGDKVKIIIARAKIKKRDCLPLSFNSFKIESGLSSKYSIETNVIVNNNTELAI